MPTTQRPHGDAATPSLLEHVDAARRSETSTDWDQRYASNQPQSPGTADDTFIREVSHLVPGTALDVCCGEGSNAIWLAQRGWDVTAIDVSSVALSRAADAAAAAGADVRWIQADLTTDRPTAAQFDLVSAMYPALLHTPDDAALGFLLGSVAPGGTLLFVHHEPHPVHREHGFEPEAYLDPNGLAGHLGGGWTIDVHETRPRPAAPVHGGPVVPDVVLRARHS